jgi:hypothetical protein
MLPVLPKRHVEIGNACEQACREFVVFAARVTGKSMNGVLPVPSQSRAERPSARALIRLSRSTVSVVTVILLLNAVIRPYSDLIHDARLYSIQVLDQIDPGVYSDDLYLQYGSQDKFSVFSRLVAPVAEQLGVRGAFFACYLLSIALLFTATWKYFRSLSRTRLGSILALVFFAVTPIYFGGLGVFQVNETMLTPRLPAMGFVLLSLQSLCVHRVGRSLFWLIPALLLHPVMAFGGLLVWIWYVGSWRLNEFQIRIATASAIVSSIGLLCWFPVAVRLLGAMDFAWKDAVLAANYYAAPFEWEVVDWFRIATAFAIVTTYRQRLTRRDSVRRVLDAILIVGSAAVVGGVIAPMLPYALPLQGQPYRALWILQLAQLPLLVELGRAGLRSSQTSERLLSVLLVGSFLIGSMTFLQNVCGMLVTGCVIVGGARTDAQQPRFNRNLLLASMAIGVALAVTPLLARWEYVLKLPTPLDMIRLLGPTCGALLTTLAALAWLARLSRNITNHHRFAIQCTVAFLGIQALFLISPALPIWGRLTSAHERRLAELREFLHQDPSAFAGLPTVYWPQAQLDDIWVRLRAKSFYTKHQTAGNMFHRDTAIEGRRRAHAVAVFEFAEFQRRRAKDMLPSDWRVRSLLGSLGITRPLSLPTVQDLEALCQEPIDYVITTIPFHGRYARQVGPLYVYDCKVIRGLAASTVNESSSTKRTARIRELRWNSPAAIVRVAP